MESHHEAGKSQSSVLKQSTVWYILGMMECTPELPGRPWETSVVDNKRRIIGMVKRPFTTVQIIYTLQDVDVLKTTLKRGLHQHKLKDIKSRFAQQVQ